MKKIAVMMIGMLSVAMAFGSTIQPKATLEIKITGVPVSEQGRLNNIYPVSESGTIEMWMIGTIRASGMTNNQLAQTIASRYKQAEIYTNPVFLIRNQEEEGTTDKRTFTVGGQVRSPGPKPWMEGMTLYGAIQAAGGETPYAALTKVKLYRNGKVYTYNLKSDQYKGIKIYNGDTIDVPQTGINPFR